MVKYPRLWDYVAQDGGRSIVVGVPQTLPAPAIDGELIAGFEGEGAAGGLGTFPPGSGDEVPALAELPLRRAGLPQRRPRAVLELVARDDGRRAAVMEQLVTTRPDWRFAMLCEIAPDRLHHCFWSDHDPGAPPARSAVAVSRRHPRVLPRARLAARASLIAAAGDDIGGAARVSDHGAKAMHGGVCINECCAKRAGWC